MNTISIVLLHGLQLVREALKVLIETDPELKVVGDAGCGIEGTSLTERLQPDVLILSLDLPGLNGFDVIREVTQRAPKVRILVLHRRIDESIGLQAIKLGATGVIAKDSTAEILSDAIRAVAVGDRYLCAPITESAVEAYLKKSAELPPDLYDSLSFREREVFQLAAEGRTSAEIGDRLSISPRTVESHRLHAMHKLDLRTRTDMIRYAMVHGMLQADK